MPAPPAYGVILAGGAGTRLWPLAGAGHPKPFLPLIGGRSLFRLTFERIAPLVGRRHVLVVAGREHRSWVRRQTPEVAPDRILLEETGRNTAAAVAAAALWIQARSPDAVMIVLPSDHHVAPVGAFLSTMRLAIRTAARTGDLVTLGVRPRSPETGFGYIRPADGSTGVNVSRVSVFVEKPDLRAARRMLRSGRYLWNSGMFVWRASSILEELRRHRPQVLAPLRSWASGRTGRGAWTIPARVVRRVPPESIDTAVLEKSSRSLIVRAPFRWSDLGSWDALGRILPRDGDGNGGLGSVVAVESSGCLGVNPEGLTVFVGVSDLAAIRAGGSVLVCHRKSTQRVREAVRRVRELRAEGLRET